MNFIRDIRSLKMDNLNIRYFVSILALLLIDLVILLNIPYLREFFSFIFFTFVPGILVLHIFRLDKIEFTKKIALSMGVSVSILIFAGLLLNIMYPLINKPLSLVPVLILLNIIVITLLLIAYKRNNGDYEKSNLFNFKVNFDGKFLFPLILAFIFPFMAIFGTFLMNMNGNNLILMALLLSIPFYILLLTYLRDKIPLITYPIALWMIGLSLLLMAGLTSNHLVGRDVFKEFYCFKLTLDNYHWEISNFYDSFNACLSITILPTVYQSLSGIGSEYVFKLFYAIIGSIIPLISFNTFQKHIGTRGAFFSTLLIIFMAFFVASIGSVRQLIALTFFFLAVMVLFDDNLEKLSKKVLLIIFMISIVLSHYATAYLAFALLVPMLLLPFLKSVFNKLSGKKNKIEFKNFEIIIPFFIFVLIWYLLVAQVQISGGMYVLDKTSQVLQDTGFTGGFTEGIKDNMILAMFGIGINSIPNLISAFVHDTVFFVILIGLITLIVSYRAKNPKLDIKFFIGISISVILLALLVIVPNLSIHYPAERVFIQSLIFLAPLFVIGGDKISKIIKKPKSKYIILFILIVSLFSCNTYLQYHFYGIQYSPYYENDGNLRNEYFVYDQEIVGAEWLKSYHINGTEVYTDGSAINRLLLGRIDLEYHNVIVNNQKLKGYILLRYINLCKGILMKDSTKIKDITYYELVINNSNVIYQNGKSEVLLR